MKQFVILFSMVACASLRADDGFEKTIRPLFLEHCVSCHGLKKQSAGLRLDTVAGIRTGADDGPVIVAGKPNESRLVKAIRHTTDVAMPPKKKLSAEAIASITAWVERGAALPKEVEAATKISAKDHWAFQPVKPSNQSIDELLEAKLKEKGLAFNPSADRRTLLRRVTFDLIGLPPSAAESDRFANDTSPLAYERIIDKLLASPQYGERWARHWLDLARYADTKGYVFTEDRNFPYAYTYRDYVIRSFNEDKPYDRFVVEQIAADKLDLGSDNRALAALGFLTLGRRFNNNIHDIIDDRIEVVTRGFLGLSVGCARCHDHKFDPIPIGDYYSLYGVFASSMEPGELPLLNHQPRTVETTAFEAEVQALEDASKAFYAKMVNDALKKYRTGGSIADYLLNARELDRLPPNRVAQAVQERKLQTAMLDRWRKVLTESLGKADSVFSAWNAFAAADAAQFPQVRITVLKMSSLHPIIRDALIEARPATLADVAVIYGELIASSGRIGKLTSEEKALRALLQATTHLDELGEGDEQFVEIAVKQQYRKLRNSAQNLRATSPNAPARAMVLNDRPTPVQSVVFLRGNAGNPGPVVPRQFLSALSSTSRKPFANGSGRLELAEAIASKDNPLTARVMVNRVWTWHFGQGLVRTPSDFGIRSDPASHPELLDTLASQFVEDNWSVKKLHRRIVLSKAYQQSSAISDAKLAVDPENMLLSRSPRKRLEFEPLRDAILAASGTLDLAQVGGRSQDIFKPGAYRRSVYTFIERQNLPGTLRSFDLASPDAHVPMRYRTTVPQQALFLMNSPFLAGQAKAAMDRPEVKSARDDPERISRIYRAVLGRVPSGKEAKLAIEYIATAPTAEGKLGPWEQLVQTLLMSNEFAFVD